jgi:tape measure domain-containing protein
MKMDIGDLSAQFKVTGVDQAFNQLDQQTTGFVSKTNQKFTGQSLFKSLLTGPQSGQAVFAQLEKDANNSLGRITAAFQGATSSFFKGLAGGFGVGGGIFGLIEQAGSGLANMVKGGVALNQQIERSTVLFTTLSGNAKEAAAHIADLQQYSLKTGVDLPQLLQGSERLQVFGFKLKDTTLLLHAATDQAALFGNSAGTFDRIVQALGLLAEKGTVANRQITQLERQGVPAFKYLAEATGQSVDKLKEWEKLGILRGDVAARMVAEGIERHHGGVSEQLAQSTGYGLQDATTNALALQAARGTSAITGALKTAYSEAFAALSGDGATAFADNINKFTGGVFSLLATSIKAVSTGEFATLLETIGKDAMNSLWGGLSSVGSKLFDAGKNAAQMIVGGTQTGLDAHSPSKVMFDLGFNAGISLLTGFDLALQQQTEHVLARVGETLQQIADRFKVPVETLMQLNPGIVSQLQQAGDDRFPVTMKELPAGLEINLPSSGSHARSKSSRRTQGLAVLSAEIQSDVEQTAQQYGIDPALIFAMIQEESRGNTSITSPKGARGILQLMPETARRYGLRVGGGIDERTDPVKNLQAGIHYMADLLQMFNGNIKLALAGYNAGAGAVQKYGNQVPPYGETQKYVKDITERYGKGFSPQLASPQTAGNAQLNGLLDYYRNLIAQLTTEEAQLNNKLGNSGDYFATLNGQQRGLDVQFSPQTAKLVDDLSVVRRGLKEAQEKLAQLEQQQRELAAKVTAPEISIPTEWSSVTDFISQINPSGASGILPTPNLISPDLSMLDTDRFFPTLTAGVKDFAQSMAALGVELPPVMQDLSKLNEIAAHTGQTLSNSAEKQKEGTRQLADFSKLASKEMSGIFTSSFDDAFSHINQGFKVTVGTFVSDFALGVARMIEQAEAAKLAKLLFGTTDDENGGSGGGGWLSGLTKFIGKLLGFSFGGGSGGGGGGFDGFVEGDAMGNLIEPQPGGRLIRVGEGGFAEAILSTDPSYRDRTARLMGDFIDRTNIIPQFEMGGWTNDVSYQPSFSHAGFHNSTVHHHHYEINIHHQTRSGYMQPPDRIDLVNRLADAITQRWR